MKPKDLEGRIAIGLDEFMLRLGHLTILGRYLESAGGSRDRVSRGLAAHLVRTIPVAQADVESIGRYVLEKQLAGRVTFDGASAPARKGARYDHLSCKVDAAGRVIGIADQSGRQPEVWMQDYWLAQSNMPSHVGAVTISVNRGAGKTGVSHLVDWGLATGLTNSRLGLTALGRAIVALADFPSSRNDNPYLLKSERIAYLWLSYVADGDVLSRALERMSHATEWRKAEAVDAVASIGAELLSQARAASARLPIRTVKVAKEFAVEVGLDPQNLTSQTGAPSSAWHRVSSRLETLVDLGLAQKILPSGYDGRYEYLYRISEQGLRAVDLWENSKSTIDFLERHAAQISFGFDKPEATPIEAADALSQAYQGIAGPTGAQIDAMCVFASAVVAASGRHLSVGSARERLVAAAVRFPGDVALSRGYAGSRAESVSIRGAALSRLGQALFL